jgi:hypothetical protein
MMLASNGEEKTRLVRGRENQDQCILDSNLDRNLRSSGESIGDKPLGVNRNNGTPRPQSSTGRADTTGKIIRQLIGEYRNQVAAKKQEIEQLELKIEEFECLLEDTELTENQESE